MDGLPPGRLGWPFVLTGALLAFAAAAGFPVVVAGRPPGSLTRRNALPGKRLRLPEQTPPG